MFSRGLSPKTQTNLDRLSRVDFVKKYYLSGGTAAALHLGHRLSYDLDWFSPIPVHPNVIFSGLTPLGRLSIQQNDQGTFNGSLNGVKLIFFIYPYKLLYPPIVYQGIKVADLRDISCMKLDAVSSRGKKRDFIDLFFISQKYSLEEQLRFFERRYEKQDVSIKHIIDSLVYFNDAENDALPEMFKPVNWQQVKHYFEREVKLLAKQWGIG